MSNDNNNIQKENSITGETPGQLLAKQRKKSNLSEREAADALKISVSRLKSIENDEFSVFPSETYIKGHLKNYSRLLKCHEQEILNAYRLTQPEGASTESVNAQTSASLPVHHQHKRWWLVYGILLVFTLVWIVAYWLLGGESEPQEAIVFPGNGEVAPVTAVESPSSSEQEASPDLPPSSEDAIPNEASALADDFSPERSLSERQHTADLGLEGAESQNKGGDEQALVVSKLTAAELVESIKAKEEKVQASVEKVIEGDTLEFDFENASWIQVTDATGKVLFKGLNKPGAELALNGTAPFNIVIGNVEGTSLVYNGENVALDAPAGKKILRLTLGG